MPCTSHLKKDWLSPSLFEAGCFGLTGALVGNFLGKSILYLKLGVGFSPYGLGAMLGSLCLLSALSLKMDIPIPPKIALIALAILTAYLLFQVGTVTYPLYLGLKLVSLVELLSISLIAYAIFRSYQRKSWLIPIS